MSADGSGSDGVGGLMSGRRVDQRRDGTLAEKLDRLFAAVPPGRRREYSFEEAAAGIAGRGGPTISATYLWQLRRGLRDNPTKRHLEAMAGVFGVSPAYFFDDEGSSGFDAEPGLAVALRDPGVRSVALRSWGLSAPTLSAIAAIVEQARVVERIAVQKGRA